MPRPGPKHGKQEKSKDFFGSMKRLIKELKNFTVMIIISLVLAAGGSILSIYAPDQLSNLTDEISNGLVVNQDAMQEITETITSNFSEDEMTSKMMDILDIQIDQSKMMQLVMSGQISSEDLSAIQNKDFTSLSDSTLDALLNDSEYDGIQISKEDKKALLSLNTESMDVSILESLPDSIQQVFFKDFEYDNQTITYKDQIQYLILMSSLNEDATASDIYAKVDEMPVSIQNVIKPSMNMDAIKKIVFFLAMLYICSALFTFIQAILMATVSNRFAQELRQRISHKINKLPLKFFDSHQTGDTLSRVTNDVDTIAQSMNQSLSSLVSSITLFVGTIIMMFITNWIMALTAIASSLLGFVFMALILKNSQQYFSARQRELGKLNSHIEEIYSGLLVVKAYNGKKASDEKFDIANHKVYDANRKAMFMSGLMQPLMGFIGNFGYVAVCVVGAILTMNNVITFGVIVAFMTYVRLFTSPLQQIAQAFTSLQSTAAASERVFEFLDEKEMSDQKEIHTILDTKDDKGNIEFDHVHFGYNPDRIIIEDFTAKAYPGQKIAIVGPTGAGKTTMVNLLMKFYEIHSGDIKIDGISTKELTRENIHSLFTMVLQDTWLFEGTIRDNIVYNKQNVTDQRVMEVCDVVGLTHFIKTLPHGLDTVLGENDSVSAGQKQLLTIARGMLDDSPFLILDEATSNVDTRTEELVQKAMDKLCEGRTSFIIAHRLSTIKNADLILVMKDGNIIETGNHDALMKQNGFYSELYNSQFEL